jgi:hypothetical protein
MKSDVSQLQDMFIRNHQSSSSQNWMFPNKSVHLIIRNRVGSTSVKFRSFPMFRHASAGRGMLGSGRWTTDCCQDRESLSWECLDASGFLDRERWIGWIDHLI